MNLWHNLHVESITLQAEVTDKLSLLALIAKNASQAKPLQDIDEKTILQALTKREKLRSTGLAHGIAIPHCSFDHLQEFVIGVITTATPIDFSALDEKPSQIFIFLIGPNDMRNEHVRLLAAISKAVREKTVRTNILQATTPQEIVEIFNSQISAPDLSIAGMQKSQLTVFIQKEEYFDEILEAVSSEADGSVAVIETENANQYLYHMPLFAAFWSDRSKNFSRVLIAVIDRESVNSVLRRIRTITNDIDQSRGVMVTVHDLAFTLGSLDF
ncbi:MAG: PTS sugar transporter subunit IIA [Spirochaetia bacterium]|jgi:mannitol/fructose-specific phosphotransferase system IIA component (Ntr-type)|nr:PTS sugar transporter subunit IIA [Spirochaetia bacterium]